MVEVPRVVIVQFAFDNDRVSIRGSKVEGGHYSCGPSIQDTGFAAKEDPAGSSLLDHRPFRGDGHEPHLGVLVGKGEVDQDDMDGV